jgi:hypothetical protein
MPASIVGLVVGHRLDGMTYLATFHNIYGVQVDQHKLNQLHGPAKNRGAGHYDRCGKIKYTLEIGFG